MTVMSYDERPSPQPSFPAQPEVPDRQPHDDSRKPRAVAQLLEHGVLSHVFGQHGEYKVRTTMTTRQGWQYRCSVLRNGKPMKAAFLPVSGERKPPRQWDTPKLGDAEDLRLSFAQEAVDIHFTRCAALQEYLVLAAIYDPSLSRSRRWSTLLAPLIGITVIVVGGFWLHAFWTDGGRSAESPPRPVAEQGQTSQSWGIPLPFSSSTTGRENLPEEVVRPNPPNPAGAPKAVSVNDLFAFQGLPTGSDLPPRARTFQASPGAEASGVQVGDVLLLSGWLHRISRTADNSYRLHMSPSRDAGARDLIAMVPPPEKTTSPPDVKAQLQTVRTFIRQQLLRQQEPSLRGSVMQRPIYMRLTGQLSYPAASSAVPAQEKRSRDTTARWEIRPVVEVQFATPSEPSDRSRPQ